ncbi:MAG: hypothetical protein J6K58_06100 [Lachnospiraceae bacterium]|nr:hypothetical protein [Lachnospiraceae bacterium]
MIMQENEKEIIMKNAKFLENMGYEKRVKNHTISYFNSKIEIIIIYEPNSDVSDVSIKFLDENEIHSIGWIACVRSGVNVSPHDRLNNVLKLLGYIKENYNMIANISYCKESSKLISEFIVKKRME